MSAKKLFNKIMATNLLVSMSGVIPSRSSFQFMLYSRIEAFSLSLQGEGHSHQEIDALLRLICHISELLIQNQFQSPVPGKHSSPLSQYFYPKVEGNVFTLQHHHLLTQSSHPDIAHYVQTLSTLCPSLQAGVPIATPPAVNNTCSAPQPDSEQQPLQQISGDIAGLRADRKLRHLLQWHIGIAFVVLACVWAGCYSYLMTRP
ncbi:hypothetical protein GWD52_06260 [Enterobacteriaceae bacterium 4M9]|nr:hypothetical protein [Enterobacteriaceae bacterium 4M9]